MKYIDIIRLLKNHNNPEVNNDAVKKCCDSLPEVIPKAPITPLLKQQLSYFPKCFYIVGILFYTVLFIKRNSLGIDRMLQYSSILIYIMIALIGIHIIMSDHLEMKEIEYSCKYQYSHILLTRMLISVSYIALLGLMVNLLLLITFKEIKLIWNMQIFFPVIVGLVFALFTLLLPLKNINTEFAALGILMVVSTVFNQVLTEIQNNGKYNLERPLTISFIVCVLLIAAQCRFLIERRFSYEAYNM